MSCVVASLKKLSCYVPEKSSFEARKIPLSNFSFENHARRVLKESEVLFQLRFSAVHRPATQFEGRGKVDPCQVDPATPWTYHWPYYRQSSVAIQGQVGGVSFCA